MAATCLNCSQRSGRWARWVLCHDWRERSVLWVLEGWGLDATGPDGRPRYDERGGLPLRWLRLLSDRARVRVEVWDTVALDRGVPVLRRAAATDESGRGLDLVRALSLDWGWDHLPAHDAKRVWALLPRLGRNFRSWTTTPVRAASPAGRRCVCGFRRDSSRAHCRVGWASEGNNDHTSVSDRRSCFRCKDRSTPSRMKPARFATREDAWLSALMSN